MATQLNIKDEETVRLVREHAAATGRTVTATVRAAIENDRRAHAAEIATRLDAILEIVAEFQGLMPNNWRGRTSRQIMDAIYAKGETR